MVDGNIECRKQLQSKDEDADLLASDDDVAMEAESISAFIESFPQFPLFYLRSFVFQCQTIGYSQPIHPVPFMLHLHLSDISDAL